MVANLAYILGGITLFNTDPTPFSFALSLTLVVWLVADNRWIDVNAIARELLFYNSTDPVFVVDPSGAAIETNPAAADLLRREADPEAPLSAFGSWGRSSLSRGPWRPDVTDINWVTAISPCAPMRSGGGAKTGGLGRGAGCDRARCTEKAIAAEQMQAQFLHGQP